MIFYGCPACQTPMSSPDSMAGQKERCSGCGQAVDVPGVPVLTPRHAPSKGLARLANAKMQCLVGIGLLVLGLVVAVSSLWMDLPERKAFGYAGVATMVIGGLWALVAEGVEWWQKR